MLTQKGMEFTCASNKRGSNVESLNYIFTISKSREQFKHFFWFYFFAFHRAISCLFLFIVGMLS